MKDRGWRVITVDINPSLQPDIVADVRSWSWDGQSPDLIWASPPCEDFARESMPWCRTGRRPDMSIIEACLRIIHESRPRYWVIENVRGAVPFLGKPRAVYGPFYLWGFFPDPGRIQLKMRRKESYSSLQAARRAEIPRELSSALARTIEAQSALLDNR